MGCNPEIKNFSLREKVKYFTMLKYWALTQLIFCIFSVQDSNKTWIWPLFSCEVIFWLHFWHHLEPCHSVLCWLSLCWLGSWGNLPPQWCSNLKFQQTATELMGTEKLWWSQEKSLQLPLGGPQAISMTRQSCLWRKWVVSHTKWRPKYWAPRTSSDLLLLLKGGKKKGGIYLNEDNSLLSFYFLPLLYNIVYELLSSATQKRDI